MRVLESLHRKSSGQTPTVGRQFGSSSSRVTCVGPALNSPVSVCQLARQASAAHCFGAYSSKSAAATARPRPKLPHSSSGHGLGDVTADSGAVAVILSPSRSALTRIIQPTVYCVSSRVECNSAVSDGVCSRVTSNLPFDVAPTRAGDSDSDSGGDSDSDSGGDDITRHGSVCGFVKSDIRNHRLRPYQRLPYCKPTDIDSVYIDSHRSCGGRSSCVTDMPVRSSNIPVYRRHKSRESVLDSSGCKGGICMTNYVEKKSQLRSGCKNSSTASHSQYDHSPHYSTSCGRMYDCSNELSSREKSEERSSASGASTRPPDLARETKNNHFNKTSYPVIGADSKTTGISDSLISHDTRSRNHAKVRFSSGIPRPQCELKTASKHVSNNICDFGKQTRSKTNSSQNLLQHCYRDNDCAVDEKLFSVGSTEKPSENGAVFSHNTSDNCVTQNNNGEKSLVLSKLSHNINNSEHMIDSSTQKNNDDDQVFDSRNVEHCKKCPIRENKSVSFSIGSWYDCDTHISNKSKTSNSNKVVINSMPDVISATGDSLSSSNSISKLRSYFEITEGMSQYEVSNTFRNGEEQVYISREMESPSEKRKHNPSTNNNNTVKSSGTMSHDLKTNKNYLPIEVIIGEASCDVSSREKHRIKTTTTGALYTEHLIESSVGNQSSCQSSCSSGDSMSQRNPSLGDISSLSVDRFGCNRVQLSFEIDEQFLDKRFDSIVDKLKQVASKLRESNFEHRGPMKILLNEDQDSSDEPIYAEINLKEEHSSAEHIYHEIYDNDGDNISQNRHLLRQQIYQYHDKDISNAGPQQERSSLWQNNTGERRKFNISCGSKRRHAPVCEDNYINGHVKFSPLNKSNSKSLYGIPEVDFTGLQHQNDVDSESMRQNSHRPVISSRRPLVRSLSDRGWPHGGKRNEVRWNVGDRGSIRDLNQCGSVRCDVSEVPRTMSILLDTASSTDKESTSTQSTSQSSEGQCVLSRRYCYSAINTLCNQDDISGRKESVSQSQSTLPRVKKDRKLAAINRMVREKWRSRKCAGSRSSGQQSTRQQRLQQHVDSVTLDQFIDSLYKQKFAADSDTSDNSVSSGRNVMGSSVPPATQCHVPQRKEAQLSGCGSERGDLRSLEFLESDDVESGHSGLVNHRRSLSLPRSFLTEKYGSTSSKPSIHSVLFPWRRKFADNRARTHSTSGVSDHTTTTTTTTTTSSSSSNNNSNNNNNNNNNIDHLTSVAYCYVDGASASSSVRASDAKSSASVSSVECNQSRSCSAVFSNGAACPADMTAAATDSALVTTTVAIHLHPGASSSPPAVGERGAAVATVASQLSAPSAVGSSTRATGEGAAFGQSRVHSSQASLDQVNNVGRACGVRQVADRCSLVSIHTHTLPVLDQQRCTSRSSDHGSTGGGLRRCRSEPLVSYGDNRWRCSRERVCQHVWSQSADSQQQQQRLHSVSSTPDIDRLPPPLPSAALRPLSLTTGCVWASAVTSSPSPCPSPLLPLSAGVSVLVLDRCRRYWWYGRCGHRSGWFPSHRVQLSGDAGGVSDAARGAVSVSDPVCHSAPSRDQVRSCPRATTSSSSDHIRAKVVVEIIQSEQCFVQDLQHIVEGYLSQVQRRPDLFTAQQTNTLFGNVQQLLALHVHLLRQLRRCVSARAPHTACLGRVFCANHQRFAVYTGYCNNHPAAVALWRALCAQQRYRHFFEACRLLHTTGSDIALDGFLLTPVQKLCRYPLQLGELLRRTPPHHPDHRPVSRALGLMRAAAVHVNEAQRHMESVRQLALWQSSVDGWLGADLVESSTVLLHQADVTKLTSHSWGREVCTLFLFDHLLVYCRRDLLRRNSYQFRGRIDLDLAQVIDLADGKDELSGASVRHAVRVTAPHNNKWYIFCCKTEDDKLRWLLKFREERLRSCVPTESLSRDRWRHFATCSLKNSTAKSKKSSISSWFSFGNGRKSSDSVSATLLVPSAH